MNDIIIIPVCPHSAAATTLMRNYSWGLTVERVHNMEVRHISYPCQGCTPNIKLSTKSLHCLYTAENDITSLKKMLTAGLVEN